MYGNGIKNVTRIEIIDGNGKSYTSRIVKNCTLSYLDKGKTLKIFIYE